MSPAPVYIQLFPTLPATGAFFITPSQSKVTSRNDCFKRNGRVLKEENEAPKTISSQDKPDEKGARI